MNQRWAKTLREALGRLVRVTLGKKLSVRNYVIHWNGTKLGRMLGATFGNALGTMLGEALGIELHA